MPTHNIVLTEHQENFIEGLVRSGRYQNASEVLSEALQLIERRETDDVAKLEALRAAVRLGAASFERGEFKEFSDGGALGNYLDSVAARVRAGSVSE